MEAAGLTLVEVVGLLPGASNATLLARDAAGRAWVYKPESGERPLWDFAPGSLWRREVACHRLSAALGLDVVPETVVADGPYGIGSAQEFLTEDTDWDARPSIVEADPALWPIVVLDLIANNADRKAGHLLRQPGREKVWAIDNGLSFHADPKLRTVLWSFAGRPLPAHLVDRLSEDAVAAALDGMVDGAEIEAAVARTTALRSDPVHPAPPTDRPPLPWPVW